MILGKLLSISEPQDKGRVMPRMKSGEEKWEPRIVGRGTQSGFLCPHLSQPLPFEILGQRVLNHLEVWEVEASLQRGLEELHRVHLEHREPGGGSGALSLTLRFLPQSLGLSSSHDRALVKRKVKELAAAAEKERKAQEKAARQREKLWRREQEAKKS